MSFAVNAVNNAARAASHAPTGALSDTARQAVDKATDMGTLNPGRLAEDLSRRPAAEREQLLQEISPGLSPRDAESLTQELAARGTPVQGAQPSAGAAKPKADEVDAGELALDLAQIGLDIAGIFDPTPISDGANTLISLGRGDWLGAGLSAVSMIPYVGDLAKAGKLGKYAETVAKAVDAAKANPALAEKLAPALKTIRDAIDQLPLEKLPDSVREGLAPIKGKLDEFARIGVREVTEHSAKYGKNEVTWIQNAHGETIGARGTLREVSTGLKRSSAEVADQAASASKGVDGDVGGHIIGHRFIADQGIKNMFPQNAQFNNSAYKKLENEWSDWIKSGKEVEVDIQLKGSGSRPDEVIVKYKVIDPETGKTVHNDRVPFMNEAGQTYDRVSRKDM